MTKDQLTTLVTVAHAAEVEAIRQVLSTLKLRQVFAMSSPLRIGIEGLTDVYEPRENDDPILVVASLSSLPTIQEAWKEYEKNQ